MAQSTLVSKFSFLLHQFDSTNSSGCWWLWSEGHLVATVMSKGSSRLLHYAGEGVLIVQLLRHKKTQTLAISGQVRCVASLELLPRPLSLNT